MSGRPPDEGNPAVWLQYAESSLILAREGSRLAGVRLSDLCFHAQQAAEKAIKAILVSKSQRFPRNHDIGNLLTRLMAAGVDVPANILRAADLSTYAIFTRYPGGATITEQDYQAAVRAADGVVAWARAQIAAAG